MRRWRRFPGWRCCLLVLLFASPWLTVALAQEPPPLGDPLVVEPPVLSVLGVGLSGGFPAFQSYALDFSVQYQWFGVALKGSYGTAGPFVAMSLRGYPPLPIPVPTFVGLGVGFFGDNLTEFAYLGAHVPLARRVRLNVEGGVSRVELAGRGLLLPYLSVGVGYVFTFDFGGVSVAAPAGVGSVAVADGGPAGPGAGGPPGPGGDDPGGSCEAPPDEGALRDALERSVRDFLADARAIYGSVYRDLSYDYRVTGMDVDGMVGVVRISYRGSVTEILTGKRLSASGEASAVYRWTGCAWREQAIRY